MDRGAEVAGRRAGPGVDEPEPAGRSGPGEWYRGIDGFVAADIDGDGQVEVVIYNNNDLWTGC